MTPSRIASAQAPDRWRGYTLIEMLIVCAVLAALAGMTWPAMRGMLARARLQHAAGELQTALRKTRSRAIEGGAAIVLLYEPGGTHYRVAAWNELLLPAERAHEAAESTVDERTADGLPAQRSPATSAADHRRLPVGVRFVPEAGSLISSDVEPEMSSEPDQAPLPNSTVEPRWGAPIVFRANGRTDNAAIRLVDDRRFVVEIRLRGLTGIVTASAPRRLSPAADEQPAPSDFESEVTR